MTSETETALERAFRYYGADHSARTLQAAARELLAMRREIRAKRAASLCEKRAAFAAKCRAAGMSAPDLELRGFLRQSAPFEYVAPRATLPSLRRELASLRAAADWRRSESFSRRMNSLSCGLQDSEDMKRAEDETLARIIPRMIRIIEKESR